MHNSMGDRKPDGESTHLHMMQLHVHRYHGVATDAEAGPAQVFRMLRVNPAAGQAFSRFMVGRIGVAGGSEPGSACPLPINAHDWVCTK